MSDQPYLMIENKGEAPVEGYTVLGLSTTRGSKADGVIGQFGSGNKHAINVCLRNGLTVWVYCGTTRLEFSTQSEMVDDGLVKTEARHVVYRKGASAWKKTGWVLDMGVLDWDSVGMGLREFVSNAIDRTIREGDINSQVLVIKTVDPKDRRARAGFTRIFVELNTDVRQYYEELGSNFLHFSDDPSKAVPGILEKTEEGGAKIYREGVYVRALREPSLFDYNFSKDDLPIDECRNSSEYVIKASVARMLGNASQGIIEQVLQEVQCEGNWLETNLDTDYLFGSCYTDPDDSQSESWSNAWAATAGVGAVVCRDSHSSGFVERKGLSPGVVKEGWLRPLSKVEGVQTCDDVLDDAESAGKTITPAGILIESAMDKAWDVFESAGLTRYLSQPQVLCFEQAGEDAHIADSYYCGVGNLVYIRSHLAGPECHNDRYQAAIGVCALHISSDDGCELTPDDLLIKLVAELT